MHCYPAGKPDANYTIPDSVTIIGRWAFEDCTFLASITIPDSVTSIGKDAFGDCHSLVSITIPGSVTSIGDSAFIRCTSLASITIADSVSTIGNSAFFGCTSLASITIPKRVTSIGKDAFYECTRLAPVTLPLRKISLAQGALDDVPLDRQSLCALCLFNTGKYAKTVLKRPLPENIDDVAAYMLSLLDNEGKDAQCVAFVDFLVDLDSVFVFIRNEYDNPKVPPWASKLVLEEEEI